MEQPIRQEVWNALEQHELPENQLIYDFSGMLIDDIQKFSNIWATLPLENQRQLITKLKDMTEADFAVDFSAIFLIGLETDDPDICISALEGLAEYEDIRLVSRLFQMLQGHHDSSVRAAAVQLLASFVLRGELGKIQSSKFTEIMDILSDTYKKSGETIEVKRRALEAMAYTGSHEVPELIQVAYNTSIEKMTISAVFAMGRSADKRWSDIVHQELLNPNPEIRFEATRACGEIQIKDAIPELIDLAEDSDIQVQEMALWSLGQIGGALARRTLEQYLLSENEALSSSAQQAIDELDFFQNGLSSFLGPPSEFNGEGEESWHSPEGFLVDNRGVPTFGDDYYYLDEQNEDEFQDDDSTEVI